MTNVEQLMQRMDLPVLDNAHLVELGIALLLAILALGAGQLVKARLGPMLSSWLHGYDGHGHGPLADEAGSLIGWITTTLLLGVGMAIWPWGVYALLLYNIALAFAAALLARSLLIGVGLKGAPTVIATFAVLVAMLSRAVGGLEALEARLDSVGFSAGSRHFSVLSAINIVLTIAVLFTLVRIINRVFRRIVKGNVNFDATQQLLIEKIATVAIVIAAFFVGIDLLGIDLTAFAVFSGALGLAVGFGLQKTVGNLIAGIILLMDRSIKPGDVIVVADAVGRVNKIGVRAVSVITRDGKEHLVPNELLMTERVENWSYSSREVRIKMKVGISYDSDLRVAQRLMIEAADEAPRVLKSPAPVCWITGFGDSSVDHELRLWISDPESGLGNIQGDVYLRIWDKFRDAGIEIPYPQRDVHIREAPAGRARTAKAAKPK